MTRLYPRLILANHFGPNVAEAATTGKFEATNALRLGRQPVNRIAEVDIGLLPSDLSKEDQSNFILLINNYNLNIYIYKN